MASDTSDKKDELLKQHESPPHAQTTKNTSTLKAKNSLGSDGKKESTPTKAKESTLEKAIEIDIGNTLSGPIELFILQYLPEILDNKKIFKAHHEGNR
jgi:hypothetical protein